MRLAATQIAEPAITMSRTTKIADSAAHMIFFCQAVGYLLMLCQAQVRRTNSTAQSRRVSGVFSFHLECRRAGSTWRSSQRWTTLLRFTFAHHRLRTLDFLDEILVLRIQSERLLPRFQCLRHTLQLQIRVADMLKHDRIIVRHVLGRTLQIGQSLLEFSLAKFEPAETVEERAVVWLSLHGPFDHGFGFIEVLVLLNPHVTKVIAGVGRVRRVHGDGFAKQIGCLFIESGLLGGRAVVEIETGVYNLAVFHFCFMSRFFECCDCLLWMLGFALGEREVVDNLGRVWKAASRLAQNADRAFGIFDRTEK